MAVGDVLSMQGIWPTFPVPSAVVAATPIIRRTITIRPLVRPLPMSGAANATAYTDRAPLILHPRVAGAAYAAAYTEAAVVLLRAALAGAAYDQGEFEASATLVDEDLEALVLMGVL